MNFLNNLFLFLLVPGCMVCLAILSHRGAARRYKIVKETDSLGTNKYEVWFEHYTVHGCNGWIHKETFDTEELADQFIARHSKIREIIKEGSL